MVTNRKLQTHQRGTLVLEHSQQPVQEGWLIPGQLAAQHALHPRTRQQSQQARGPPHHATHRRPRPVAPSPARNIFGSILACMCKLGASKKRKFGYQDRKIIQGSISHMRGLYEPLANIFNFFFLGGGLHLSNDLLRFSPQLHVIASQLTQQYKMKVTIITQVNCIYFKQNSEDNIYKI